MGVCEHHSHHGHGHERNGSHSHGHHQNGDADDLTVAPAPAGAKLKQKKKKGRKSGPTDAELEAYVLAHCKKIRGTYGSSFSALASRWLPRPRGSFELMRVQEAG